MTQTNGGSLTNPKTWSQIVAAMPVTIGILVILALQLYLSDQNARENRQVERDELKSQKEFNGNIEKLFSAIAENSKRNADAMEKVADEAIAERIESTRFADAVEHRNELLKEHNAILREK